jgi:hypothetical protein
VTQLTDISGRYAFKLIDQKYELLLNNDSSFIYYLPQNNMESYCHCVEGKWERKKNKIILNTNDQSYYELSSRIAQEKDSLRFEICSIIDNEVFIYPFTKVVIFDELNEIMYEGEINDKGYVKFPVNNLTRNKITILSVMSLYLSGEYSSYIEKGFDYKLVLSGCMFTIWKNKNMVIKKNALVLKDGKYKDYYLKEK